MKNNKSILSLLKIKSSILISTLFFTSILLLITAFTSCQNKTDATDCNHIDIAINESANYLSNSLKDNGMFVYRKNMDPSVKLGPKYNILRHAGTIYSLAMYYNINPDENLKNTIEKSSNYLINESLKPLLKKDSLKAIWSRPEVNRSNKPLQAKLGGSGLGLVALLSAAEVNPELIPISELEALGRFIVYMQKENGSFCSKYIPSQGGCQDNWVSLYYPGEAALGLVMLYEKQPNEIWLKSAHKAIEYLAKSRKNQENIPADHWALLATNKLLAIEKKHPLPISKELLINHAIQICESILKNQVNNPSTPKYNGGFTTDGRTTPTATRLEGLQAALNFIPKEHEIWNRIDASITPGISFLLQAQIKEGKFKGAFPRAVSKVTDNNGSYKKFNQRVSEIRIDYIQHAMSALIQYKQLNKCTLK